MVAKKSLLWTLIFFLIVGFLCIPAIEGYYVLKDTSYKQLVSSLDGLVGRLKNDLKFKDGFWDISLYNSDPYTTYPNAPSSFPVYIITSDGFVIERSRFIHGFLDAADFKYLLQFKDPQTVQAPTKEEWRLLSKPIIKNNRTVGVIMVSKYQPETKILENIDQSLEENINTINSKIKVENNEVNADDLDLRDISFDVAFEIVDSFNKVILSHSRVPSTIDPSHIEPELSAPALRTVVDEQTKEPFLVRSELLYDKSQNPIGLIAMAKPLNPVDDLLKAYRYHMSLLILLSGLILSIFCYFLSKRYCNNLLDYLERQYKVPKMIIFYAQDGMLNVNGESISIPKDSYQYQLCLGLFSNINQEWHENDLLKNLEEDKTQVNWRKIYDAYIAINKKIGFRLINYKNKAYSFNPEYRNLIKFQS